MPGPAVPKTLAPKPAAPIPIQLQPVPYHPGMNIRVHHQIFPAQPQAIAVSTPHFVRTIAAPQVFQQQRPHGFQPAVLNAVPNGQYERDERDEERDDENDDSGMPQLDPASEESPNEEGVDNQNAEEEEDPFVTSMFMNEARIFRRTKGHRVMSHVVEGVPILESNRPFSTREREAFDVHEQTPDTSFEEEPTPAKRRRAGGVGSRGGRGRGGRGRGRGGRGGRNRRVAREIEVEHEGFDAAEEPLQEPVQESIEPQQEPAPVVEEEPVEEREEAPAPVGKKQKRKRNQVEMLGEGFDGHAFETPAKGRRRSTIEARPKETREPPMTRQKRKEREFGDMEIESPAATKATPSATPEPANEESPASVSGKLEVCAQCKKIIPENTQWPQYCSQNCRRAYIMQKDSEDDIRQEEPEEEEEALPANDYHNDDTIPVEDQIQAARIAEQDVEEADRRRNSYNEGVVVAAPAAQDEASAPNLRAALESTPSPPAINIQEAQEEEEQVEYGEEQEQLQPDYDLNAPQYWTLDHTAVKLAEYMQKNDKTDMFVANQIDGYTLWTENKLVPRNCKIPLGPVLTAFKAFAADSDVLAYPRHTPESPPAFDASGLDSADSVRQFVAQFTNPEVADELFMCNLDAIAISSMSSAELMECSTSLKLGYAYKIAHIFEENKKVGVTFELNVGDNLPMRLKTEIADCFALCMCKETFMKLVIHDGIDSDVLYQLTMTDLVKGLDLKYGVAKRLSRLIEQARLQGGASSPALTEYHGPSTTPMTPEEVLPLFFHVLPPAEREKFRLAEIRGDMLEYLTTQDLCKLGFQFVSAKKVCFLIEHFKEKYGWTYDTLKPESQEFLNTAVTFTERQVYEWISTFCPVNVAEAIRNAGIDGSLLHCLNPHLLSKHLKIGFNHAKTICVQLMNLPPPNKQKLTSERISQLLAEATSPETVEALKVAKVGFDNFISLTFDDLIDRLNINVPTSIKIIGCLKKVELPHVLRFSPDPSINMNDWSHELVYEWMIEMIGIEESSKIQEEQLDGNGISAACLEDLTSAGISFGPAKILHTNLQFWSRV